MKIVGFTDLKRVYNGYQHEIYQAIREVDAQCVAIKVPVSTFPEPRQIVALQREHQILNLIGGQGIPKAVDFIEFKNSACVVRQWVEGISLRDYFEQQTVSLHQGLLISIELARIIGQLHRQNYCHRDISEGNIIINTKSNQLTLIDYSSALEFPNRARRVIKPKFIEGSISYMSPEQTGRMNRGLDFRTDFYSLGVLLYQLFTQRLPFTTQDNNRLIHSHIALEPKAPSSISADIPTVLSNIILKLMSKSPDARYQSAQGIQADLERCLLECVQGDTYAEFELATEDLRDWFIIPDKLYGRKNETHSLVKAFEQTRLSKGQLLFVTGPSGIGKTSLIKELYRPLAEQGGYISSGKYDQVMRHQPYFGVIQALSGLIKQIIADNESRRQFWQTQILQGVGHNGQILIDAIPELEYLIGKQPPVAIISDDASSTRFNTTFYNLLYTLSHSGVPLVLFFDDLQWIDQASLALIEALTPTLSESTLMLIGAYRSNEVDNNHPLMLSMPRFESNCTNTSRIELSQLPSDSLNELLYDTLDLTEPESSQLNRLIFERSHGNPLIYRTMLFTLYSQNSVCYDYDLHQWRWNRKAVEAMPHAQNSVAMLKNNMREFTNETIELIKTAGCIGNHFDLDLLARLTRSTKVMAAQSLLPAIIKGFIQPLDDDFELYTNTSGDKLPNIFFKFTHDRVQQAAYGLVTEAEQAQTHWQIGLTLLDGLDERQQETKLFDAVEHLNQGSIHASSAQSTMLIDFNLKAGKRAKQSAAYDVAYSCLEKAFISIGKEAFSSGSEYAIEVGLEFAQACYLAGQFDQAESLYQQIKAITTSERDLLKLANIQAKQYHHQGLYQQSVEQGFQALRLLGITLPDDDDKLLELFAEQKAQIERVLQTTTLDVVYQQDHVEDEDFSLTLALLFDMFGNAYLLGRGPLLAAIAATSARLAIERGNCAVSSVCFIHYATILCSSGEYLEGHQFGRLAVKLADKYQHPTYKNYTYHVFSLGINHWREPLSNSYYYWHEASKLSKESGSPFAGWVFLQLPHLLFASGTQLAKVEQQVIESYEYLNSNQLHDIAKLLNIIVDQPLRHLTGKTFSFDSLDDANFCTAELMATFKDAPFFLGHTVYSVLRATLLSRNFQPSKQLFEWLPVIENTVQAQIILVDSYLFTALHLCANYNHVAESEKQQHLSAISEIVTKFERWAQLCPSNYLHKLQMLQAELLRLKNRPIEALNLYEQARESALESRFLMDAALCDELAGFFWLDLGVTYQSDSYLRRAISGYHQWGASGKVTWLKQHFPHLSNSYDNHITQLNSTLSSTVETDDFSAGLDMKSVLKTSQAVSQHIHLDTLAKELLDLAVENAGATQGILLLENENKFTVTHTSNVDTSKKQTVNIEYTQSSSLSHAMVRYVLKLCQPVVYTSSGHSEQFERCPYLQDKEVISVLCLPIVRQNKISGVLYLENTHTADAFQLDRVQTLEIIASQAAISLENAQMYQDLQDLNKNLEQLVNERTKRLYQANQQLEQTNQDLYTLSTTDGLTQLYNRRYVEEYINDNMQKRQFDLEPMSILMLDVDHFKSINDTFGHSKGDHVLVSVAKTIKQSIDVKDIPARWGGEEFIVICPTSIDAAINNAQLISNNISNLDLLEGANVTVSIGVTPCLQDDTIDNVLSRVDEALYQAKNNGRNQVILKKN